MFNAHYEDRLAALAKITVPCLVIGFGQDTDGRGALDRRERTTSTVAQHGRGSRRTIRRRPDTEHANGTG
jgi:hypothetical protein